VRKTRARPLAGRGVVVTRPAHQARQLASLIEAAGGRPFLFPVLEIRDVERSAALLDVIDRLDEFELAVFVSPNAVERGMALVAARREWPRKLKVAAIGGGSLRALERYGMTDVTAPEGRSDSEALLDLPALSLVFRKRIVVFRGVGGRELLGETLTDRGAVVEYAECYQRVLPDSDVASLLRAWTEKKLDAVTVTSSEGLRNLFDMVGAPGRESLLETPLFVTHPRIAETAQAMGVRRVVVTGPGNEGLVAGLSAYFDAHCRRE